MSKPNPPALVKRNTLQALARLRGPQGNDWCVFAFVLNHDVLDKDGKVDDFRGMVFLLGSFGEQAQAERHAKGIIELTGHTGVIVSRYAHPVPLTLKFDGKAVVEVPVDNKGKLVELETAQYKYEHEEYERRVKREKELTKEAEEETDRNSIEHFKRHCYLAIKNRAAIEYHKKQLSEMQANYEKHQAAIREHYTRHPEHEEQWLPHMKKKLLERGEEALYVNLENGYNKLRDELLGPVLHDDCLDDICPAPSALVKTTAVAVATVKKVIATPDGSDSEDEIIAATAVNTVS